MSLFLPPLVALFYIAYGLLLASRFRPLRNLPGPPATTWFGNHLQHVSKSVSSYSPSFFLISLPSPIVTPRVYEMLVNQYGRSLRIRGLGPVRPYPDPFHSFDNSTY
jgi:hypothetical protein